MTETQSHYATPGSHNFKTPSRDEFHRYASDLLSETDFCTDYPAGYIAGKIASSLRWTINNSKQKNWGERKKNANK